MQNSIVMFTFSVFDRKFPFGENLVQKIKIISLSCSLFDREYAFWTNLVQKVEIIS